MVSGSSGEERRKQQDGQMVGGSSGEERERENKTTGWKENFASHRNEL